MLSKMIVGYDGSDESEKAYKLSLDLAKRYSAGLIVLSVVQPLQPYGEAILSGVVENGTTYFQAQFVILKQQALSEGVAARFEIRVGHPAQEIVTLAEAEGADAIVVGHRGQSRLQQWLLGSVAKRVLAYAKCHVIVAH